LQLARRDPAGILWRERVRVGTAVLLQSHRLHRVSRCFRDGSQWRVERSVLCLLGKNLSRTNCARALERRPRAEALVLSENPAIPRRVPPEAGSGRSIDAPPRARSRPAAATCREPRADVTRRADAAAPPRSEAKR